MHLITSDFRRQLQFWSSECLIRAFKHLCIFLTEWHDNSIGVNGDACGIPKWWSKNNSFALVADTKKSRTKNIWRRQ